MKKNLTKKLMLSVLTLAFAVVSLGASTFAWFTTSESAQTGSFDAEVIGGSGIELGVAQIGAEAPATYYVNTLPASAIQTVLTANGFDSLNHVSGINKANTTFNEALYNLDNATIASSSADDKDYVAFRVFVKVNAKGKVVLNNVNVSTSSDPVAWNAGVEFNHGNDASDAAKVPASGAGSKIEYSVLNAVRVSATLRTLQADEDGKESFTTVESKVYEQAAGNGRNSNSIGFSNKGAYEIYNAKTVDDSQDLDILKTTTPDWECETFAEGYTTVENKEVINTMNQAGQITVDVERDQVICFDVFLWIEGYDAECVNAIFGQYVSLVLGFNWAAPAENE